MENVGRIHPALVGLAAEAYADEDERLLKLTKREITWGEFALRAERSERLEGRGPRSSV